ncbi:MAG: TRAP transporter substrate-binding protein [Phycisphaerales bacterium]|nr:TRAP transporter substrate-binding protein [Phycisphaerales bacterium]
MYRWAFYYGVILSVLLTLGGCRDNDDTTILKLAHGLDAEHPVHRGMEFMAQRVAEKSGGRLLIEIFPSEQLGSERECIEQVQLGMIAMTKTSSGPMEGFVPNIRVFGLPYLFRDDEHMWKVLQGPIGKELLNEGRDKYLKGLCYYDAGARSFYTKDRPIHTPEDLRGLKLRVQKSAMSLKMVLAMGGAPTPIDWGELYSALQQGVIDGAENNPPSLLVSRHYEICKYYTLNEHLRMPDILIIGTKTWDRLSPEFKEILQEAADESVAVQRELWMDMTCKALEEIEKSGVTLIRPDLDPFRDSVQSLWAEFEGTEVGALAERVREVR